ncbi:MAG: hypothetical protein Fur002_20540 [Anaerolineales bacterium]
MNNETNADATPRFILPAFFALALAMLFGYVYVYQIAPFEETLNSAVLNTITAVAAQLAAGIAFAVFSHYHLEDFPRKIWMYIAIACGLWFAAETIWGVIAFYQGEVASPGVADAGWVIGFIFFTIAFYYQYAAIYPEKKKQIVWAALGAWALALFAPLIGLLLTNSFSAEAYINYYYPIADLAVGVAGIALMFVFRGGALARPWIGLVVLGVSDFFYAWAEQSGLYAWSANNSNLLTVAIDSTYLAAYLILSAGFLAQWVLIHYGVSAKR